MSERPAKESIDVSENIPTGTTYKVYRYILKQNHPVGISEVQKGLELSSPSVAQYHIKKLLRLGMIREEQGGYVIDKMVLENIIRIGRLSIPIHIGYLTFFAATLFVMLVFLRPIAVTPLYLFALFINLAAIMSSIWEVRKSLKRL